MTIRDKLVWHRAFLPDPEIPERFRQGKPADIKQVAIQDTVRQYLLQFEDQADLGIAPLFLGPVGTWKTYGACVVARYAHWRGFPTRFVQAGPVFLAVDAAFYQPEGMRMLRVLSSVPFLVLDDFTQVQPQTRSAELMANVVAERFAEKLPTVVTGNADVSTTQAKRTLGEKYRPDFIRRLWHGSEGFRVTLK